MKYKCAPCNYETNDMSNFERHKNSKKHIVHEYNNKQAGKVNKSAYIGKIKVDDLDNAAPKNNSKYKKLEEEIARLKKIEEDHDKLKEDYDDLKHQNDRFLCLMEKSAEATSKSVRGITYAMKHLNNAQQLKMLEGKDAIKLLTYDNTKSKNDTVELIVTKYKNDLLDRHLGDILVKAYKKDDPQFQSVWGIDATRMHFILKQKKWTNDNCGVKLTEFVIDPFLRSVEKMIQKYCIDNKSQNEDDNDKYNIDKNTKSAFDKFTKKWGICQEILMDISKKKIHKQILKYISPRLKLTQCDIDKTNNEYDEINKKVTPKTKTFVIPYSSESD